MKNPPPGTIEELELAIYRGDSTTLNRWLQESGRRIAVDRLAAPDARALLRVLLLGLSDYEVSLKRLPHAGPGRPETGGGVAPIYRAAEYVEKIQAEIDRRKSAGTGRAGVSAIIADCAGSWGIGERTLWAAWNKRPRDTAK